MEKRFVATDPGNETLGASMLGVIDAMGEEIHPILNELNLQDIDADTWYPQQQYLDVYNAIYKKRINLMHNLVAIGMKTVDNAAFPPQIETLQDALMSMDAYYHLNNRDKAGKWDVQIDDTSARCTSTTPFPPDFEYGILYALVRRFVPKDHTFKVKYEGDAPEYAGADHPCTYLVTWEPKYS